MSLPPLLIVWAMFTLHPVTISVYPHFSLSQATFRITVLVPRHFENRRICYAVDGPELKRSCEDLAGWESRKSWTVYWTLRSPGEYEATAILTRSEQGTDKLYTSRQPFRVLGGMEP